MSRQPQQGLRILDQRPRTVPHERLVPAAEEAHYDRDGLVNWCVEDMPVHGARALGENGFHPRDKKQEALRKNRPPVRRGTAGKTKVLVKFSTCFSERIQFIFVILPNAVVLRHQTAYPETQSHNLSFNFLLSVMGAACHAMYKFSANESPFIFSMHTVLKFQDLRPLKRTYETFPSYQ